MNFDEELLDHLALSLYHLGFVRELAKRTGKLSELEHLGWAYGANMNGSYEVEAYDFQLQVLLNLLAPTLQGAVDTCSGDDEWWDSCHDVRTGSPILESDRGDFAVRVWLRGPNVDEVVMWRHFIHWQRPDAMLVADTTDATSGFLWILWEPHVAEIMDAWEMILRAWEEMQDDHGANRGVGCEPGIQPRLENGAR